MSDRLCPKCAYPMEKGRRLATFTTEVSLVKGSSLAGDSIDVYICPRCGYIELYREKLPWTSVP